MPSSLFLELEKLPDSSDTHLWADYVELRCLADPDLMVSKSDIQSFVMKRKDLREGLSDYADDDLETENETSESPADIKRAARGEDLFRHLQYRAEAFNDFYPFTLSRDGDILLRKSRLTSKHKLYVFFLLSSNTRHIKDRQHRNKFTDAFEIASVAALKRYLPRDAEVHLFGTNSLKKKSERYTMLLLERIRHLAKDLREDFVGDEQEFAPNDNGDNGLDVVGWIPLGDDARGFLLVFGQCACSYEEWPHKQSSSSALHWRDIIRFKAPPCNMTFIPFCYRRNTGKWHMDRKIDDTILMDRLRLVKLLRESHRSLKELPYKLINEAIDQRILLV